MSPIFEAIVSWPTLILAILVFGLAPGVVLRLISFCFEKDDPRRKELIAELYVVPRWERPFWVAEQLERAVCEGLWERMVWAATGRIIHRVQLGNGVKRNKQSPESFWIPSVDEKAMIQPGDIVKLMFETRTGPGERMWVRVSAVGKLRLKGTLMNDPIFMPRLSHGKVIRFRREHVIDIDEPQFLEIEDDVTIGSI